MGGWFDAFYDLSTDRQLGMAAGPIPDTSLRRYTDGWPDDDADAFKVCMRAMDAAFLEQPGEQPDPELAGSTNPARDAFRSTFGR